jgi:orotidine-5'-phosphate decarboxylase
MNPIKSLIVALDVDSSADAKNLVQKIGSAVDFYKVAPSMTLKDPTFVPWLLAQGKKIFLDCKWYDIPSQVKRSVQTAGGMGIASCTIHTSAGASVIRAALEAFPRPQVWGVTVLTSLGESDIREVGIPSTPQEQVLRLAKLAQSCGIDGLVCSANEVALLRQNGITVPLITPGIQWGDVGGKDQKRVATPQQAWADGSNYLVIGRAILESKDPAAAAREILELAK